MEVRPHLSLKEIVPAAFKTARVTLAMAAALSLLPVVPRVVRADGGDFVLDPTRVVRVYTQCGGGGYPDNDTVMVQQVRNPDGFNLAHLGPIEGQCGNRWTEPDSAIQTLESIEYQQAHGWPVAVGTADGRVFYYSRTYPQCGGSIGAMDIKPNYTVLVDEFVEQGTGAKTYSWRTVGPQQGQCGNPE